LNSTEMKVVLFVAVLICGINALQHVESKDEIHTSLEINPSAFADDSYRWVSTFIGTSFFDYFTFFNETDPTRGFVEYVDKRTALKEGLVKVVPPWSLYMGADATPVSSSKGRKSVRIHSTLYWTEALYILDLDHMPGNACGVWPAFWTLGDNWPNGGEVDIIENVNKADINAMTLHTAKGCTMNTTRVMSGKSSQDDCDVAVNWNAGCGVTATTANTFGDKFNKVGGGIYAMQRTKNGIKVWHFPKNEKIPIDLFLSTPQPSKWPTPNAHFPFGANCNSKFFGPHQIIFDITFCGDWAGNVFSMQGCGDNCTDFVKNNGGQFKEAYWLIKSLRVFSQDRPTKKQSLL